MFAVSSYKEIERIEKEKCSKHLIAVLFVRPNSREAEEIIRDFEYLHYRTGMAFSIYAAGYTNAFDHAYKENYQKVTTRTGSDWFFGAKDFSDLIKQLSNRMKNWSYSGNIEILLFQGNESDENGFDFRNYVSLDITYGIRAGYISTFSSFMESMVNHVEDAISGTAILLTPTGKIKVREIIEASLKDCNDTLIPIKDVMKNRHFYKIPSADNS